MGGADASRYVALDGLRGVAAVTVFALHALIQYELGYLTPHAMLAVDFFFLLSGFVIDRAYRERLDGGVSIFEFVRIRIIRLGPLYMLGLGLGALAYLVKIGADVSDPRFLTLLGVVGFGLLFLPHPMTLPGASWGGSFSLNPPAWSLSVEVLVNILYAVIARFLSMTVLIGVLALGVGCALVIAWTLQTAPDLSGFGDFTQGALRVVFPFFMGVFLSRVLKPQSVANPSRLFWGLSAVLCAVFFIPTPGFNGVWYAACVFVVFPLVVAAGARLSNPKASPIMTWLGDTSYAFYITHWPVLWVVEQAAERLLPEPVRPWAALSVGLVASLVVAHLATKLFDGPVRAWLTTHTKPASTTQSQSA